MIHSVHAQEKSDLNSDQRIGAIIGRLIVVVVVVVATHHDESNLTQHPVGGNQNGSNMAFAILHCT